jgi:hypothetical protein
MIAYCSNNINNNMNNNIMENMNNSINMLPIIPLLIDPNYWGVEVDDMGNSDWGQYIDLETNDFIGDNNTSSSDYVKETTYNDVGSYYGTSKFSIISLTLLILNLFDQAINIVNNRL